MKLETTAGMLKAGLDTVGRAIEARNTIPVLSTVKFDRDTVTATNLDLSISATMPARAAEGSVCVPFIPLHRLVGHIPAAATVRIEGGKEGVSVYFDGTCYDLPAQDAADFPDFIAGDLATELPVDGDGLKKALKFVRHCISTEETRYYLNGVCLDGGTAVATDGHRLACHPLGFDAASFAQGILTRETAETLLALPPVRSFRKSADKLTVMLDVGSVKVSAKLIDGTFPDWRRVVPDTKLKPVVTIDRLELRRRLRRMVAVSLYPHANTQMAWANGNLALVLVDETMGKISARETLSVQAVERGGAGFSATYLNQIVEMFTGAELSFSADPVEPSKWQGEGDAFAVLMPRRGQKDDPASALLDTLLQRESEAA